MERESCPLPFAESITHNVLSRMGPFTVSSVDKRIREIGTAPTRITSTGNWSGSHELRGGRGQLAPVHLCGGRID